MCSECGTNCIKYPGKFEGCPCPVIAEKLYDLLGISGQVEDLGDAQDFGFYALVELDDNGKWYITNEDSQGFFMYEEYESEHVARAEWILLETEYEKFNSWMDD